MNKILCVYNICGISKDNTEVYPYYLEKLLNQDFDGQIEFIVSACQPKERTIPHLKSLFPQASYLEISDRIPINVSFNHAVLKGIEKWGKFDAYAYVTCDSVMNTPYDIQNLFDIVKDNQNIGMVSARIDHDSCYSYGILLNGINHPQYDKIAEAMMFKDGQNYKMQPGQACAAHVNLYSSTIQEYYSKCCPDIFSGYSTESVFHTICSALKLDWIIGNVLIGHTPSLDCPSAGFRPEAEDRNSVPTYYQGFIDSNLNEIFGEEYKKLGGVLENCQGIIPPNIENYDNNGWIKNEQLKEYIKNNIYLSKEKFDYNQVNSEWF